MGVVGAGIATVIGQVAAGVLFLAYLPRLHTVRLRRQARAPPLGSPGGFWPWGSQPADPDPHCPGTDHPEQPAAGSRAASVYGSDIALSVYGMMMKVYQIAHSMFVGVSSRRTAYQRLQLRGEAFSSGAADLPHGRRHRPGNFGGVVPRVPAVSPGRSGCCSSLTAPLPGLCPALLPAVYGRLLPVRPASGHRLFLSRDRPAGTLPCHSPWPGRACFPDSPGYSAVRPVRPGWCPAGRPISDMLTFLLSLLCWSGGSLPSGGRGTG